MTQRTARLATSILADGRRFVIENPMRAYLWLQPDMVALGDMEGVMNIDHPACAFSLGTHGKQQRARANCKALADALGRWCPSNEVCVRTGAPRQTWQPYVDRTGRVKQFRTGAEAEYKSEWCKKFAEALRRERSNDVGADTSLYIFTEVFSGPSAPLKAAVADAVAGATSGATAEATVLGPHHGATLAADVVREAQRWIIRTIQSMEIETIQEERYREGLAWPSRKNNRKINIDCRWARSASTIELRAMGSESVFELSRWCRS